MNSTIWLKSRLRELFGTAGPTQLWENEIYTYIHMQANT